MYKYNTEWVKFRGTGTATITNTLDEMTQIPSGDGSLTFSPNELQVGNAFRVKLRGLITNKNTNNNVLRVKFGGVTLLESTASVPVLTDSATDLEIEIKVCVAGASGEVCMNGTTRTAGGGNVGPARSMYAPATAVDLSVPVTLDITYQWGEADPLNILTISHASIEAQT